MTSDVQDDPDVRRYPFGEATALELDPTYATLRGGPLSRVRMPYGGECWLAVRHDDVRTVLSDPRFSRAATVGKDIARSRPEVDPPMPSIVNLDPPEHTRLRTLAMRAFTNRRVEDLRPRAVALTRELLAAMRAAGPPADLVTHLSGPLPITLICEMLGVPVGEQPVFQRAADAALATTSMTQDERMTAWTDVAVLISRLIAERRAEPADDLLTALVQARDDEDRLSEEELLWMGITLLVAGYETTLNHLANLAYTVLTTPGTADALRADPSRLAPAVEEMLRFVPIGVGGGFGRIATEDVELGGVAVRAGDVVMVALHAANRDERVFDDPERFDIGRTDNPHLALGFGPHHCLGAQMARMELQVALGELLREFPGLRLAVPPEQIPWRAGALVRGPLELPVRWD